MRDANAAAHNAQRQQVQQSVGAQAPPIATQVSIYIYVLLSQNLFRNLCYFLTLMHNLPQLINFSVSCYQTCLTQQLKQHRDGILK